VSDILCELRLVFKHTIPTGRPINHLFKSQWKLLDSFYSFKEVYTVFLTLPLEGWPVEIIAELGPGIAGKEA
jgi:hypothetical protein